MFVQKQYGKAEEAMRFYVSIFDKSRIEHVVPYDLHNGEKEGAIKHASFSLYGEQFIVMDSSLDHKFTFTPAVSFMVQCDNQKEIDYYWSKLSAVPEAEQCGWLQDKYGISWQIDPVVLGNMIKDKDTQKSKRVTRAMLQMKKIDIATLMQAYESEK
jgi:predicted 3-demethylubiquinone-9 3-methyltransferase (glyoxalase superfamily)